MREKKQSKTVSPKEKYETPRIQKVKLGNSYKLAACGGSPLA